MSIYFSHLLIELKQLRRISLNQFIDKKVERAIRHALQVDGKMDSWV